MAPTERSQLQARRPAGAQTVERAFDVLACFREQHGTISVSEIARRLDLNVSNVYRLVRTMERAGFLEQDEASRRYRLGTAFAGFNRVLHHQRGFHLARPELRWLSDRTGGSATLALRDGREALVVGDMPAESGPEGWDTQVANAVPLHVAALGKALLAWSDVDDDELAELAPFERFTEWSIGSVEALRRDLATTRERGYAVASRELSSSQLTVAVPILDGEGRSYLALGVGVVWSRSSAARVRTIARLLEESAVRLRELLVVDATG